MRWGFHLLVHPWLSVLLTLSIGPWGLNSWPCGLSQAQYRSQDETQPLLGLENWGFARRQDEYPLGMEVAPRAWDPGLHSEHCW